MGRQEVRPRAAWLAIAFLIATSLADSTTAQEAPLTPPPDLSSIRFDEIEVPSRNLLARADQLLAQQQWDEAIDALRRVLDTEGERLLRVPTEFTDNLGFARYVPARVAVQGQLLRIQKTQPAALRGYRKRLDNLAERWYREGVEQHDRAAWQRVVDQSYLSHWTDKSLMALGDDALERRHFIAARRAFEQLASPADPNGETAQRARRLLDLQVSESDIPVADVDARLILVSIFSGELDRARREVDRFRTQHVQAPGRLAGQEGTWVELLEATLTAARTWPSVPNPTDGLSWFTSPTDGRSNASSTDLDLPGRPTWTARLPRLSPSTEVDNSEVARFGEPRDRLLPYFPRAVGPYLLVSTPNGVYAWNRATGRPAFSDAAPTTESDARIFEATVDDGLPPSSIRRVAGHAQFLLSASGQRLYAKVGPPWTIGVERQPGSLDPRTRNAIVGLDLAAEGKVFLQLDGASLSAGSEQEASAWSWEGPPLVRDGRLYVGFRRNDGLQTQLHVICCDADSGRVLWKRHVASADVRRMRLVQEWTNQLLTLHEDTLYYNTQVGVVAALDARDGSFRWLTRYPQAALVSDPQNRRMASRDVAPCLVANGRVFVAPSDSPRIFALDTISGAVLWSTDDEQGAGIAQLLGVGHRRLIASGDALYWLDVDSGAARGQFPPAGTTVRHSPRPAPSGYGRGLLTAEHIWWPVAQRILVFEQETQRVADGWRPRAVREISLQVRGATAGNLLLADGMLFIAGADTLYAFQDP